MSKQTQKESMLDKDAVFALAVAILTLLFFIVLFYFILEGERAKHLSEAAAKGADPVALSCAMGKTNACKALAGKDKP